MGDSKGDGRGENYLWIQGLFNFQLQVDHLTPSRKSHGMEEFEQIPIAPIH